MCGRSRQTVEPQSLASAVGFDSTTRLRRANDYSPRENAHPGNATPIAYKAENGVGALRSMRWGLIPSFTKAEEKPDFFRMFNARKETVTEKPSFRRLVNRRRGIVAFSGFYEWKRDELGEKQPYYLHFEDDRPMLMATLYDSWYHGNKHESEPSKTSDLKNPGDEMRSGSVHASEESNLPKEENSFQREDMDFKREAEEDKDGRLLFSYTVLTTSSSARLKWLHHRMPVILAEDAARAWLNNDDANVSSWLSNCESYNKDDLVWHPVTKKMSSIRYEGHDCSDKVELKAAKPLAAITSFFSSGSPSGKRKTTEEGFSLIQDVKKEESPGATDQESERRISREHHLSTVGSDEGITKCNDDKLHGSGEYDKPVIAATVVDGDSVRGPDGDVPTAAATEARGTEEVEIVTSPWKQADKEWASPADPRGSALASQGNGGKRSPPARKKPKRSSPAKSKDTSQPRLTSFFQSQ